MNISSLKKEELTKLDDSINSKIKDSSYAPIDLTTVDTNKKVLMKVYQIINIYQQSCFK